MRDKHKLSILIGITLAIVGSILTAILAGILDRTLDRDIYFEFMGGIIGIVGVLKFGEKLMQELPFWSFGGAHLGLPKVCLTKFS